MKPSNDREAVSLIIDGLIAKGVTINTARDGENEDMKWNGDKKEFIDHLMSCDEGVMFVTLADQPDVNSFVYFVYGNDPEEVVCDHTVNLSPYVDPIVQPWWE
jgi:hypothetical protein